MYFKSVNRFSVSSRYVSVYYVVVLILVKKMNTCSLPINSDNDVNKPSEVYDGCTIDSIDFLKAYHECSIQLSNRMPLIILDRATQLKSSFLIDCCC
jgi:hypothetical protein